jgi:hypothetical protein
VPHKAYISRNIPAEFQEMLPEVQIYIIQKRGKKTPNFNFIQNAEAKKAYFTCLEFTLIMQKVQKKLKLDSSIMKCSVYGDAVLDR